MRLAVIAVVALAMSAGTSCIDYTAPDMSDCGGGVILGSFNGRSSGFADDTLVGCSYFTLDEKSGAWGMVLTNGGPTSTNPMIKLVASNIPTGVRMVGDQAGEVIGVVFMGTRAFRLTEGMLKTDPILTETKTTGISVAGELDITGTDSVGVTIRVRGTFVGKCLGYNAGTNPLEEDKSDTIPPECHLPGQG